MITAKHLRATKYNTNKSMSELNWYTNNIVSNYLKQEVHVVAVQMCKHAGKKSRWYYKLSSVYDRLAVLSYN